MFWLDLVLGFLGAIFIMGAVFLPWVIGYVVLEDYRGTFGKAVAAFIGSAVVLWLLVAAVLVPKYLNFVSTESLDVFTINKTERVTDKDGKTSRYLVFTDKGVFENTDSLFYLKYHSSDIYNQLASGKKYECKTVGWRVPFFSSYRNIIECTVQHHD